MEATKQKESPLRGPSGTVRKVRPDRLEPFAPPVASPPCDGGLEPVGHGLTEFRGALRVDVEGSGLRFVRPPEPAVSTTTEARRRRRWNTVWESRTVWTR